MSFLTPWVAAIAAAIVVPALLILYFLKLRRRAEHVPSTLLWRRAVQDLQVNAPFQRLRKSLLLFLQLLVLAAGAFALARPIVQTELSDASSVILLIDRSGSMSTREGDTTRFELAKEQAIRHVRTFNRTGSRFWALFGTRDAMTRVMIIAFADRATVVSPFTTNTADLTRLIEELEPSDGRTNLRDALELAQVYMTQTTVEQTTETTAAPSSLLLLSDGGLPGLDQITLREGELRLIRIGEQSDNVGITALRVQRSYERPEQLSVFCQLENFGHAPVSTDVSLYVDGQLSAVRPVALGAAPPRAGQPDDPPDDGAPPGDPEARLRGASAALSFEFTLDRAALLEARLSRADALAIDDRAATLVPAPRRLSVLLVSAGNFFWEKVLEHLPLERFDYMTPQQYETAPDESLEREGRSAYDVVVFDKHSTARLPEGNYVFVAAAPQIEDVKVAGEIGDQAMLWWDETHAILRHVALDYVFASKGLVLELPTGSETLMEGPGGPTLARYSKDGRHYFLLTFAIENSTWWSKPSFPVFVYNLFSYMGAGGGVLDAGPLRPGDPLRIPLPAGVEQTRVQRPDGRSIPVHATGGVARYSGTERVGLYTANPAAPGHARFAVNLEDAAESDIAPLAELRLGVGQVKLASSIETATPEVWRWFVGAALLIALIEWHIYNRRVMI